MQHTVHLDIPEVRQPNRYHSWLSWKEMGQLGWLISVCQCKETDSWTYLTRTVFLLPLANVAMGGGQADWRVHMKFGDRLADCFR